MGNDECCCRTKEENKDLITNTGAKRTSIIQIVGNFDFDTGDKCQSTNPQINFTSPAEEAKLSWDAANLLDIIDCSYDLGSSVTKNKAEPESRQTKSIQDIDKDFSSIGHSQFETSSLKRIMSQDFSIIYSSK